MTDAARRPETAPPSRKPFMIMGMWPIEGLLQNRFWKKMISTWAPGKVHARPASPTCGRKRPHLWHPLPTKPLRQSILQQPLEGHQIRIHARREGTGAGMAGDRGA